MSIHGGGVGGYGVRRTSTVFLENMIISVILLKNDEQKPTKLGVLPKKTRVRVELVDPQRQMRYFVYNIMRL